jgi:hypothetical protein
VDAAGVPLHPVRVSGAGRKPLEKTIVAKGLAAAKEMGWFAIKLHGGAYQMTGLPDVLAIKNGRAAWMEFKRPGEHPTKIQQHRLRQLADAGCDTAVCCSAGDVRAFLSQCEAK